MKWTDPLYPNLKIKESLQDHAGAERQSQIRSIRIWPSLSGTAPTVVLLPRHIFIWVIQVYSDNETTYFLWMNLVLHYFGHLLEALEGGMFISADPKRLFIIIKIMICASLLSHTYSTTYWWQEVTHFQVCVQPEEHVRTWSKLPEDLTDVACRCRAAFVPHFKILPNGGQLILPAVYIPSSRLSSLPLCLNGTPTHPLILPTPQGPSLPLNRRHGALLTWRAVVNCTLAF